MKRLFYQSKLFTGTPVLCLILFVCFASARAQTTAFTYQGRLSDGGQAANGTYDLQFNLFDQMAGANPPLNAQTLVFNDIQVTNGVFTVQLNFGVPASTLTGADRFLEIAVRPGASTQGFTILSPRQQITSSPYAIQTLRAGTAANAESLGGVAASQYVQTNDSRLSDSRAPTPGSGNYIQNGISQQVGTTNFNISGNGTLGGTLAAGKVAVTGGVLARGGAPGGFGLNNNGYAFSGNNGDGDGGLFSTADGLVSIYTDAVERVRVDSSGNVAVNGGNLAVNNGSVAIGATTPNAKLDVRGDIKMGASGNLFAAGAEENLRLLRGTIQISNGVATVFKGTGFTVTRNQTGFYNVNLTTPFSDIPTVVPSIVHNSRSFVFIGSVSAGMVSILVMDANNNFVDPSYLGFIAAGPK